MQSQGPRASQELCAKILDVPEGEGYSSADLMRIISTHGFQADVLIFKETRKPGFLNVAVKFRDEAELQ